MVDTQRTCAAPTYNADNNGMMHITTMVVKSTAPKVMMIDANTAITLLEKRLEKFEWASNGIRSHVLCGATPKEISVTEYSLSPKPTSFMPE